MKTSSVIKKIPASILAWFTFIVLFAQIANWTSLENAGVIGGLLYLALVLLAPVALVILLIWVKPEKKAFYRTWWFWLIGALAAVILISATYEPSETDAPAGPAGETTATTVWTVPTEQEQTETPTTEPTEAPTTVPPTTVPTEAPTTIPATTSPDPAVEEDEYKESCEVVNYKDLCRYPGDYIGTAIRVEVKIYQIMNAGGLFSKETAWRGMTDNDGYNFYFDDEYYLLDKRPEGSVKVLEDDILVVYGEFTGLEEITRALTFTTEEIPRIDVKYVEILE